MLKFLLDPLCCSISGQHR